MSTTTKFVAVLATFAVLALLLFAPVAQAAGWTEFWDDVRMRGQLWSNGAVDFDTTLNVDGAMTIGAVTSDGNLVTSALVRFDQTTETVTDAEILTPTTNFWALTSAGTVTPTLGTGAEGQFVTLLQTANQNIVLADASTLQTCGGDGVTLAQNDTVTFVSNGTNWYCIAEGNN